MKQYRRTGAKAIAWNADEMRQFDDTRLYCVKLTERQIAALLPVALDQMTWSTRWFGNRSEFDYESMAIRTGAALIAADGCDPQPPRGSDFPADWTWGPDGGLIIDLYEDCEMPIYVNIYEGCCPDNETGSSNAGNSGGAVGGIGVPNVGVEYPYSSSSSKCDLATSVVPYFITQAKEFLVNVDTAVGQGATLLDAFLETATELIDPTGAAANLVEEMIDLLTLQLDPLINALDDVDLHLQTQVNWWGRTDASRSSGLTRADAINLGRSLPVVWNVASVTQITSPRLFGEFIGRIANLNKLNAQVQLARGDADVVLCEYLAAQNGETFTPPPNDVEPPPVLITGANATYQEVTLAVPFTIIDNNAWFSQLVTTEPIVAVNWSIDIEEATPPAWSPTAIAAVIGVGNLFTFLAPDAQNYDVFWRTNAIVESDLYAARPQLQNATLVPGATSGVSGEFALKLSAENDSRPMSPGETILLKVYLDVTPT